MQHIGIDIVEINRIKKAVAQRGDGFLERVYTPEEVKLYRNKVPSLAARFAGKEAVIKALGITDKGIGLSDIEILSDEFGRPTISLYGKAVKRAQELGIKDIVISLSHSKYYAIACATGQSKV